MKRDGELVDVLMLPTASDPGHYLGETVCSRCGVSLDVDDEADEILWTTPAMCFCIPCGDDLILWCIEHGSVPPERSR